MTLGERVSLRGPLGQFNLVAKQDEPAILIGGGTGLAPLKSIVQHALVEDLVPELFLYHGGRGGKTSTMSNSSAISNTGTRISTTDPFSARSSGKGQPGWSPMSWSATFPRARG